MKPRGSEQAISMILEPYFMFSRRPLAPRLSNLNDIKITFLYGEYDWVESDTAVKLCNN